MKLVLVLIILAVSAGGLLFSRIRGSLNSRTPISEAEQLPSQTEPDESLANQELEVSPTPSPSPVIEITPTLAPTQALQPSTPPAKSSPLKSLIYPGAVVTQQTSTQWQLTTAASTQTVTDWYAAEFKSLNRSLSNVVKTNTNGAVKNMVATVYQGQNLTATITNAADQTLVTLTAQP